MNKTQRIRVNLDEDINEKNLYVRLEQDVDTFEIMSLKLKSEDVYASFNSDFGVVVGRVIANGGVGVPNAKISVFIPLTEEDEDDADIVSVYPYKAPHNKNNDGKRYNLLPRVSVLKNGVKTPNQPFGSFPTKAEILTNETLLKVYKKYYKYNAVTNDSGDYMIFGVPVGTQTLHMSVDITDIGEYSMTPAGMVTNLGYSSNLFTENNTKIKPSTDLDDLPHIETQEISVNVVPFWGDKENFEIGITRQDFRVKSYLVGQFIIFGSAFTDQEDVMWGGGERTDNSATLSSFHRLNKGGVDLIVMKEDYEDLTGHEKEKLKAVAKHSNRLSNGLLGMNKRSLVVDEYFYHYPSDVSGGTINKDSDPINNIVPLDKSSYSSYKRNGDFVFVINTNRKKIITDENGNRVEVEHDNPNGVFTEFSGFMTIDIDPNDDPHNILEEVKPGWKAARHVRGIRTRIKIPQQSNVIGKTLTLNNNDGHMNDWRGKVETFEMGEIYSIAKFHPNLYHKDNKNDAVDSDYIDGFFSYTWLTLNKLTSINMGWGNLLNNSCILTRLDNDIVVEYKFEDNTYTYTHNFEFAEDEIKYEPPTNRGPAMQEYKDVFASRWMNLSLYLPQVGYATNKHFKYIRTNPYMTKEFKTLNYVKPNTQELVGGVVDTSRFLRDDINWTKFIKVSKEDVFKFNEKTKNKIYYDGTTQPTDTNDYVVLENPDNYGSGRPNAGGYPKDGCGTYNNHKIIDETIYFYKGARGADCIKFLYDLNIV